MMHRWLALLLLTLSAQVLAVERVVSLAPSLSEIVVELGAADLLVGVLDGGERPAELVTVGTSLLVARTNAPAYPAPSMNVF